MSFKKLFFKYAIYYPVVILRGEWIYPHLRKLRGSQNISKKELNAIQLEKLNRLLEHAVKNVPFYRDILPRKIDDLSQLANLPFLEKDALRASSSLLISVVPQGKVRSKTTGGSTGAAVTICKDNHGMAQELAATWRGYEWAGIDIGDLQARFWGVPFDEKSKRRAKLIDFVTNRIRLSAFSFSDADIKRYIEILNLKKPVYFYGYVSMIRQFAEYMDKNDISLEFQLKAVITTSEVLSKIDRLLFSKVFGCKIFNEYGCGEIGTIAHECEFGGMHITAENMVVEIVDSIGNPVPANCHGEIVVTDLTNFTMPLIRYKMRDFGSVSDKACPCGRGLPLLSEVSGREYDILINKKGEKFHGEFFLYMIEDAKKENLPVQGYQVEQHAFDELTISIVADELVYKAVTSYLENRILGSFDSDVKISFRKVDAISREASGKLRVVKRSM